MKKKHVIAIASLAGIAALLFTAHMLNFAGMIRQMHGG